MLRKIATACMLLAAILPAAPALAGSQWGKIRDGAMQLRERGHPAEAYQLAAGVRPQGVEEYVDEQFTAGFLALRALGQPDLALQHFEAMAVATQTMREPTRSEARSQAGYYLARCLQTQGRLAEAGQLFYAAAVYRDTFYGLLAAQQINASDTRSALASVAARYPKLQVTYIDPRTNAELINAIIKPESNFHVTAVSPVGALGLMQLMPGTAARTARQAGVEVDLRAVANNPTYNVAVGSRYFGDLLSRYSNNIMLAAAGYNGGEKSVDGWIGRFGDPRDASRIDPVDWIELIPFKETRQYVKRVVASYVTYTTLAQR